MSVFRKIADPILDKAGYARKSEAPRDARMGFPPEKFPPVAKKAVTTRYAYETGYGQPRYEALTGLSFNVNVMRRLESTHWPTQCINHLINDLNATPWKVEPIDPNDYKEEHLKAIASFFFNPNRNRESWQSIAAKVARDILSLDAGVLVHIYGLRSEGTPSPMVEIMAKDGGRFYKEIDKYGYLGIEKATSFVLNEVQQSQLMNVGYWQHSYQGAPIPFEPAEVTYMMAHPRTNECYGLSNIETLKVLLLTMSQEEMSTETYFRNGEIRKSLFTTDETIPDDATWKRFIDRLAEQIKESPHNVIPTDTKGTLSALGLSRKDMQWIEQRDEYRKAIFGIFNVTDAEMGFTKELTKGMEESQRQIYVRKGLFPLIKLIEYHANMEIVTEFFRDDSEHKGPFGGEVPDVCFKYPIFDPIEERRILEMDQIRLEAGLTYVNEIRQRDKKTLVPWGDMNPVAAKAIQQFGQTVFFGALTPEQFAYIVNLPILGAGVKGNLTKREFDKKAVKEIDKLLKAIGEPPKDLAVASEQLFYNWKKRKWKF